MSSRTCPYCHYTTTRKNGRTSSGRIRYRCLYCNKSWTNHPRPKKRDDAIWQDFVWGKMTAEELSVKYKISPNTIYSVLRSYKVPSINLNQLSADEKAAITVISLDTTYFGRSYGIVAIIDAHNGRLLYFQPIDHTETNMDYYRALDALEAAGIHPKAAVIDGRKGVRELLEKRGMVVQLCLFHVAQIARRCLTKDPILEANIELKSIVELLYNKHRIITKNEFKGILAGWQLHYDVWLLERTYLENGHWEYTHRKTKLLFDSLKRNLDYLFTYAEHPELHIPRDSNRIEGMFGNAKNMMKLHRGYSKELKTKMLLELLSGHSIRKNAQSGHAENQ